MSDNPALTLATRHSKVLPIYILDDEHSGEHAMGAASKWWLHHSLGSLNNSLNGALSIYQGNPAEILFDIAARNNIKAIYWNRCYEPWRMHRDSAVKEHLKQIGIEAQSTNGSLLWEPWKIKKEDGSPYKIFTPFYRKGCLSAEAPREPISTPINASYERDDIGSVCLSELELLPKVRWDEAIKPWWNIGEKGSKKRLEQFLDEGLSLYKDGRNLPAMPYVSRISPHLHFGEISPNQLWYAVKNIGGNKHVDHFCSELGWREFSYSQLYHNHDLPTKNLQSKFDTFPWVENKILLEAWKKGKTGVPMVDAGMRELWQTGYMHNRVRMIVGSFLVKNLRLHWHHGALWFWDTLVDADLANNSASWQWIAGCGADSAPYFRIFNPVIQGQKFDADGSYVRKYIPEIALLPDKYLFSPWDAPESVLKEAGIDLGKSYPAPIVDLKQSRDAALKAFQSLSQELS